MNVKFCMRMDKDEDLMPQDHSILQELLASLDGHDGDKDHGHNDEAMELMLQGVSPLAKEQVEGFKEVVVKQSSRKSRSNEVPLVKPRLPTFRVKRKHKLDGNYHKMIQQARELPIAKILERLDISASDGLLEHIVSFQGRYSVIDSARQFPFKFRLVEAIDAPKRGITDRDLGHIACGLFPNLKILKLSRNSLRSLHGLHTLENLRMLDLSNNGMTTIPTGEQVWICMEKLQVLLLHGNLLSDSSCLIGLGACPGLLHLTLRGNPLEKEPGYRKLVAKRIPSLVALDDHVFMDFEYHSCEKHCRQVEMKASHHNRFVTWTECDRLSLSNGKSHHQQFNMSMDEQSYRRYFVSVVLARRMNLSIPSTKEEQMLNELKAHLEALILTRKFTSPAITIQRVFRGRVSRTFVNNVHARRIRLAIRLQAIIRGWKLRADLKKQEVELLSQIAPSLLVNYDLEQAKRGNYVKKTQGDEEKAATLIQRVWVRKHLDFHRYVSAVVIQRFARRVAAQIKVSTEQMERNGFHPRMGVYVVPNGKVLNPTIVEKLIQFSVTQACRIEGIIPQGFFSIASPVSRIMTSLSEVSMAKNSFLSSCGLINARRVESRLKARFEALQQSLDLVFGDRLILKNEDPQKRTLDKYRNFLEEEMRRVGSEYFESQSKRELLEAKTHRTNHTMSVLDGRCGIQRRIAGIQRPKSLAGSMVSFNAEQGCIRGKRDKVFMIQVPTLRVAAWTFKILEGVLQDAGLVKSAGLDPNYELYHGEVTSRQQKLFRTFSHQVVWSQIAAVKIQSAWRAHKVRTSCSFQQMLLENRAAVCIQRFWRMVPFYSRMAFVESLAKYLVTLDCGFQNEPGSYYLQEASGDLGDQHVTPRTRGSPTVGSRRQLQSPPSNKLSTCLFMEDTVLRAIRKLKGRKFIRDHRSLLAAQETPLASECCFDFSNSLKLINGKVKYDDPIDEMDHFVVPPPTHFSHLIYEKTPCSEEEEHCDNKELRATLNKGTKCLERTRLRVGIPEWIHSGMVRLPNNAHNAGKTIPNAELSHILTRGAILTSGELVVPPLGHKGGGRYFCKISMTQRLGNDGKNGDPGVLLPSNHEPTGVVLVRLKFRSRSEMMARAAICFARTWQSRTRQAMPIVSEPMLLTAFYQQKRNEKNCWGPIPSSYGSIIKEIIHQHEQIDEQQKRALAIKQYQSTITTMSRSMKQESSSVTVTIPQVGNEGDETETKEGNNESTGETEGEGGLKDDNEFDPKRRVSKLNPRTARKSISARLKKRPTALILDFLSPRPDGERNEMEFDRLFTKERKELLHEATIIPDLVFNAQKVTELATSPTNQNNDGHEDPSSLEPIESRGGLNVDGANVPIELETPSVPPDRTHSNLVRNENNWINSCRKVDKLTHDEAMRTRYDKTIRKKMEGFAKKQAVLKQFDQSVRADLPGTSSPVICKQDSEPNPPNVNKRRPRRRASYFHQEHRHLYIRANEADLEFEAAKMEKQRQDHLFLEKTRQKIQEQREARKKRKDDQQFLHGFQVQTNLMLKREIHRQVQTTKRTVHAENEDRVEEIRKQEYVSQHRIETTKNYYQNLKQEERKIYRMYTGIQRRAREEQQTAQIAKLKMKIEHEKGVKKVANATHTIK